jgi:thioredoxin 1
VVRECQGPVLVEFTAKWSASGVIVEDFLQKLPSHIVRGIRFLRIDVEKNRPLAEEYGVSTIPTYLFFAHGEPVESVPGPMSGEDLSRRLKLLCTEDESYSAGTGEPR